ncbi:acetamidase [Massilia sp. WF1]|uniref:acetamidase/formamidase family protein n=1 Tax=unclassified Massilia TaxID=2609279 RepID=UPI00064B77B2|nr:MULTISPECIES: acetamidase/formamidase family protein [unclassified Massilia]ALK95997.1 acetamidase [Massilia sp. WG5]KLU37421.1 acetamidase [Massilia sp. WF1]
MRKKILSTCLGLVACAPAFAADYTLPATPATVAWGYYSGQSKPALTVHSGDTVRMQTLSTCGSPERMIARGVRPEDIPPYTAAIYNEVQDKGPGGHILTGPVAIAEAEPGDVLEVQILKVDLDANFACNVFGVGSGFLPTEYPYGRYKVVPLDRRKMVGHFAPGIEIPLRPFFGSMGVAPAGGKIDSAPPFVHAGNMDNKELVAGATLYIPVAAKGALFQAGDGHAAQGNGEVDITALETYLSGTFRFVVHKDRHLIWPRAETPTHYISMGFSKDLKEATTLALRDMIAFLVDEKKLSRDDAYMLSSVAVDMEITQLVDGNVGVHAMLPKKVFK